MFTGFSNESIDFLWGIRFNNQRSWFEENKETYTNHLYQPMKELSKAVYQGFLDCEQEENLICRVSRIYRDARRLHGRGPYKDCLWFSMERPTKDWSGTPTFWFEITPEGYGYGVGCYAPAPVTMAKFRARLDNRPEDFLPLAREVAQQNIFTLQGREYKRPKGSTREEFQPWYHRKELSLACNRSHDSRLFSPDLVERLVTDFHTLRPMYRYLATLSSDPDPRQ